VANYEPPVNNFLDIDTTNETPKESFKKIINYLKQFEVVDF
jgi:adenylylsulfate kinase-like enzyme